MKGTKFLFVAILALSGLIIQQASGINYYCLACSSCSSILSATEVVCSSSNYCAINTTTVVSTGSMTLSAGCTTTCANSTTTTSDAISVVSCYAPIAASTRPYASVLVTFAATLLAKTTLY